MIVVVLLGEIAGGGEDFRDIVVLATRYSYSVRSDSIDPPEPLIDLLC
jgi:hypothetical protein